MNAAAPEGTFPLWIDGQKFKNGGLPCI